MPHIIIASKNPIKIEASLQGFRKTFPEQSFIAEGITIASGVNDQPLGDEETFRGAHNRAVAAQSASPEADYWVGIEGGNIVNLNEMEAMAWVVILSNHKMGKARTAGFFLPPRVIDLINQGMELGHANDIVFGVNNSKHSSGSCGLLTNNAIDRLQFYVPAVVLALIPFLNPDLYSSNE